VSWIFWSSFCFLVYVYIGFPLLLWLRTLRPKLDGASRSDHRLSVTLIIVAHNEAEVIESKLDNVASLDYPRQLLQVVVASDGSDDSTNEIVRAYSELPVALLEVERGGKNNALNQAVAQATGEVLFLTDADTMLAANSLSQLVKHYESDEVGGVTGDFRYTGAGEDPSGELSYWALDRVWKKLQTEGGNVTSATGQLYTIRRDLFEVVPDGVTDDFFLSTGVVAQGSTLVFEPEAVGFGPPAPSLEAEYRRKVRVANRGLRAVGLRRRLLNPFRYGFYSLQLVTHKVLRRVAGIPLVLLLVSSALLWPDGALYRLTAVGQLAFHGLGLTGWLLHRTSIGRSKPLRLPLFFDMANLAGMVAFAQVVLGKRHDTWAPDRA